MKAPKTAERIESPSGSSRLRAVRNNVAAIMLSAMSVAGCKVCFSVSTDMSPEAALAARKEKAKEEARESAVSLDEARVISIDGINTTIVLNRFEIENDCKTKIDAMMDISDHSPLLEKDGEVHEYPLRKEDMPWTKLVVQPLPEHKGGISLRTEGDKIAMVFRCKTLEKGKEAFCEGQEIEPAELDKAIATITEKFKKQQEEKKAHEGGKGGDEHQKKGNKETEKEKSNDSEMPNKIFNAEGKIVINTTEEIQGHLAQMQSPIKLIGYDAQKVLARRIVTDKHKAELEALIKKMDSGPDLEKLNMNSIVAFLLAANPKMIPQVAQELGVPLSKKSH